MRARAAEAAPDTGLDSRLRTGSSLVFHATDYSAGLISHYSEQLLRGSGYSRPGFADGFRLVPAVAAGGEILCLEAQAALLDPQADAVTDEPLTLLLAEGSFRRLS
jgi:hypothetical protein